MVRAAPARTVGIGRLCAAIGSVLGKHVSARSHAPVLERCGRGTKLRTPKLCTSSSYGDTGRAVCRWAGRLGLRTRAATQAHRAAAGALGILGHDAMWDDGAYAGCNHPHADHPGVPDASLALLSRAHVNHVVSCVRRTAMRLSIAPTLASTFPAWTVVGAPRSAALRVTRRAEGVRRCVYGCAAGLVTSRCAELSLAIRLPIVNGLRVYAQAAAGIVSGSVPESELREVCNKLTMALLPCTELCCYAVGAS